MKFLVVTGYYPSENTAQKILNKVKSKIKTAKIVPYEDSFCVVLRECETYGEADKYFSEYMNQKVYCGIQAKKDD